MRILFGRGEGAAEGLNDRVVTDREDESPNDGLYPRRFVRRLEPVARALPPRPQLEVPPRDFGTALQVSGDATALAAGLGANVVDPPRIEPLHVGPDLHRVGKLNAAGDNADSCLVDGKGIGRCMVHIGSGVDVGIGKRRGIFGGS